VAHTLTLVEVAAVGGKRYLRFSDKMELEFDSLAELQARAREFSREDARRLLLLWVANRLRTTPAGVVGASLTLDLDATAVAVVTPGG
jgi:hypothetical protein